MKNKGIEKAIRFFGSQSDLARALDVSRMNVRNWIVGACDVPIKRCVQIEKLTNGAVTRKDLRPNDWHEIWVELLDKPTDPAQ